MDAVAQRQDDERPDTPASSGAVERVPPAGQPPIDPEELRSFQEFQQFQEFQRYQEYLRSQEPGASLAPRGPNDAVPPPPPSQDLQRAGSRELEPRPERRKAPAWLVTLGGKIVGALLLLAAIIVGGAWAIDYFLGADDPITPEEQAKQGGKKAEGTKLYASSPYEAVRRIYDDIAQGDTEDICLRFDELARDQFAADVGFDTCAAAAAGMHDKVTNVDAYAESLPSNVSNPSLGDEIELDSCEVALPAGGVVGGPALGVFTVTKIPDAQGEQWLITGHAPGPEKCPKKSG